ncbi:Fic family protein [candidate division WOR-3 bacterium]|nr:Fic family protein [candidate division WOR-3 bacterium]
MNLKDFKAGTYLQQYQYKSFLPSKINQTWVWSDPELNILLEKAMLNLSQLDAYSHIVPDIDLFIHMHIVKEANKSSRIEGTKTQIDEDLLTEDYVNPEKRDDWYEVQNYIQAINYAIDQLKKIPLSCRLLKKTHEILLQGVRGQRKSPGEFRRSQNWIGGSNLSDAIYIPPPHEGVPELMSDLEKFWHNSSIQVPYLIRIAMSHYQFEAIHPFLDGNGRIGRLLITLYLVSNKILTKPSLYLSDFFERHRPSYYQALSRVHESNDIIHWIKFFLNAIIETAEQGKITFQKILELCNEINNYLLSLGRRANSVKMIFDYLYKKPVTSAPDLIEKVELSKRPINEILNKLVKSNYLIESTGYQRNRIFKFKKYLDLF